MENAYKSDRHSFSTQQLYAEFAEQLEAYTSRKLSEIPPATLSRKTVNGNVYLYAQYAEFGNRRQVSIGREGSEKAVRIMEHWESLRADADRLRETSGMLASVRATRTDRLSQRMLETLAAQGFFHVGGVLVGSHAFAAYELPLGVRWRSGWRTGDVDLALDDRLKIAVPDGPTFNEMLNATEIPFRGIPSLNPRSPSTSFSFRGNELRVDLLTPLRGKPSTSPIHLSSIGAYAMPLRFLGYLIEEPVSVALPIGEGVLVKVPRPARFAIHKLIVASRRPPIERAKREKDVLQAAQLIWALTEDGLEESLEGALESAYSRGKKWRASVQKGAARLPTELVERLENLALS